jgi:hypothetical protein
MYGSPWHWMHKSQHTESALALFKTLVRFRIVENIVHPGEWAIWYGNVKRFSHKYEGRDG